MEKTSWTENPMIESPPIDNSLSRPNLLWFCCWLILSIITTLLIVLIAYQHSLTNSRVLPLQLSDMVGSLVITLILPLVIAIVAGRLKQTGRWYRFLKVYALTTAISLLMQLPALIMLLLNFYITIFY